MSLFIVYDVINVIVNKYLKYIVERDFIIIYKIIIIKRAHKKLFKIII